MAKRQTRTAKTLEVAERRRQAARLRIEGKRFWEIGEALGVTEQRAHQLVTEELRRLNAETAELAEELRRVELERLDGMVRDLAEKCADWTKTTKQGVPIPLLAMPQALKVMERRGKLLGFDAKTSSDEAMESLAESLGAIARTVLDEDAYRKLVAAMKDAPA